MGIHGEGPPGRPLEGVHGFHPATPTHGLPSGRTIVLTGETIIELSPEEAPAGMLHSWWGYTNVGFRPVGVMRQYKRQVYGSWHDGLWTWCGTSPRWDTSTRDRLRAMA